MEEIKNLIGQLAADALDGRINPLDAFIDLRELEKDIKLAFDLIRDASMIEAEKYDGQTYRNYDISVRAVGGRYSYDHIDEYMELKSQMKELEKRYQESYKLSERMIAMVDDNGEQVPAAHYKSASPSIQLKAKR